MSDRWPVGDGAPGNGAVAYAMQTANWLRGTDDLLMLPTRALWEEALADRSARLVLHP